MSDRGSDKGGARRTGEPTESPADLRFSVRAMDLTVDPARSFYDFATGGWRRSNPVPADKSDWNTFWELTEMNARLLRAIVENPSDDDPEPDRRLVVDFYRAATDLERRDQLGLAPIRDQLERVQKVGSVTELLRLVADLHEEGVPGLFDWAAEADRRQSGVYAFYIWQGGLTLPDRDYYLLPSFESVRAEYRAHVARMLTLAGATPANADRDAHVVLALETAIAQASRSRADLRDVVKNYTRLEREALLEGYPRLDWAGYLETRGISRVGYVIVGQPEFLGALSSLLNDRPLAEWKTYLGWHLLHHAAPHLHAAAEEEDFAFFRRTLRGQKEPEPLWRRALQTIDDCIGEALGHLFVARHFPPSSRARMLELVGDLREVFIDRLRSLEWMTEATRERALEKFRRFEARIGHPEEFRDYSGLRVLPDDHLGNVRRAARFESRRRLARLGGPVDRAEWHMTPPMVNAYFNATQNEIFFPAGILQPPFFDPAADDAVNYGAIGVVIGHEITHGYDDQGRRFDSDGNLNDWWTDGDAEEFRRRAEEVVRQYSAVEALPGAHINGELTLGENIADFGGIRLAFEALGRRLRKDPTRRRTIDGFTPEQRFFLSYAQIWRQNCRDEELRRRLTIDPHSPGRYRVEVPLANLEPFREAFGLPPRPATSSTTIW